MNWYYMDGDKRIGPVNDSDMGLRIKAGVVCRSTPVWREGWAEWQDAGMTELAGLMIEAPPPFNGVQKAPLARNRPSPVLPSRKRYGIGIKIFLALCLFACTMIVASLLFSSPERRTKATMEPAPSSSSEQPGAVTVPSIGQESPKVPIGEQPGDITAPPAGPESPTVTISDHYYARLYGFGYTLSATNRAGIAIVGGHITGEDEVREMTKELPLPPFISYKEYDRRMAIRLPYLKYTTPDEGAAFLVGYTDGILRRGPTHTPHDGTLLIGSPLDLRMKELKGKGSTGSAAPLWAPANFDTIRKLANAAYPDLDTAKDAVCLSDIAEVSSKVGAMKFMKGKLIACGASGETVNYGIFAHAPSEVIYDIGELRTVRLEGSVGIARVNANSKVQFRIYGDGELLWESSVITQMPDSQESKKETFSIDVRFVEHVKLEVDALGDSTSDHSIWIDPKLVR
jgi:hypothetical protein